MSIQVKNIFKAFADFQVLNNVNFKIPQGELTALLGPSGCGKTTLLRIIAGLESATSGQVLFDDQDVTALSAKQRHIGFVFQSYALFRHMTVFNNITFGLRMLPNHIRPTEDIIYEKVNRLLQLIQMKAFANRYPDQLSGGQRQRVALARALANEPKVLLLDEPFGALDAKVRKELRRWLRDFHSELNVTSVFVTHDQDEALEVADKIILMNKGQVEQIGTAEEVYKRPQTAFVAHFLGDVNIMHGHVRANQLHLGAYQQDISTQGSWKDQAMVAYVRPHEISLSKQPDLQAIPGVINRMHTAGPTIFIEVKIKEDSRLVDVSIPHNQYVQEPYNIGDPVYLKPLLVNVFAQEELIEFMI